MSDESTSTQGYSSYVNYIFGKKSFKAFMTELLSAKYNITPVSYCNGFMGVPISFLDKYCPEQFEIIWQLSGNTRQNCPADILSSLNYYETRADKGGAGVVDGKLMYNRILVKLLY